MAAALAGSAIAKAWTIRKIKRADAISEKGAKSPEELGIQKSYLDKLVKLERLKRTEDGRYYVTCEDGKHCSSKSEERQNNFL